MNILVGSCHLLNEYSGDICCHFTQAITAQTKSSEEQLPIFNSVSIH